jgi:hypothetical protein
MSDPWLNSRCQRDSSFATPEKAAYRCMTGMSRTAFCLWLVAILLAAVVVMGLAARFDT